MALRIRKLTSEEQEAIRRLAHSRTGAARLVERAKILWHASQGTRVPPIAQQLGLSEKTVRFWLKRFHAEGLAGLEDRPHPGRRPTYPPEVVGEVIAASLTDPKRLGLPFGCWSVRRLEAYLNEAKGIPIKRSRIDELLLAEGLRWRTQESWFGERAEAPFANTETPPEAVTARVDPDFAEKRGRSSGFTRPRPKGASSSAWTRWDRKAPRASRGRR
jgi:transposase